MKTISLLLVLTSTITFAQGPLTPPGAPSATMKTLDQIEPRNDVLKLPGDAATMHVISAPGSYFLSANLVADSGKSGIRIDANNVNLDLTGFLISGYYANDSAGVRINEGLRNITVTNGSITGFHSMISKTTTLEQTSVSHIKGSGGILNGIILGADPSNVVEYCSVIDNDPYPASGIGISAGKVHFCTVEVYGTAIDASSIVSHSIAHGSGAYAFGIIVGADGIVDSSKGTGRLAGIKSGGSVSNSCGIAGDGNGIEASGNVSNSNGSGDSDWNIVGYGIVTNGNVANSTGKARAYLDPAAYGGYGNPLDYAVQGIAIKAKVISYSNAVGINDDLALAVGLECDIAIGCTSSGNDSITHKYLMP